MDGHPLYIVVYIFILIEIFVFYYIDWPPLSSTPIEVEVE